MERPINIAKELATLQHERTNQGMKSLPANMTVQRRPLHHAPIASPHAGAHVQKVVYVSCRTPIMSAVKRVKKLLSHVEKRAIQGTDAKSHGGDRLSAQLAAINNRTTKSNEEVLVKASGRAMSQALRVAEWFRCKEKEMMCDVEIRTGNVQAVDDIVAAEDDDEEIANSSQAEEESTTPQGGETTMELLGNTSKSETVDSKSGTISEKEAETCKETTTQDVSKRRRKRVRRKRAQYDKDDVPEARLRWIKTIELAISLRP